MGLSLEELTDLCVKAVQEKKGYDIVLLDLRGLSTITDMFIICSGRSNRQVQALADAVKERLGKRSVRCQGMEGYSQANWILMDYNDFVVHIFDEETRKFYNLENLWGKASARAIGDMAEGYYPAIGDKVFSIKVEGMESS